MRSFEIVAVLTTLAAVFGWINFKFIRLPTTIGLMVIAMAGSLGLVTLQAVGVDIGGAVLPVIRAVDFDETLLQGMLGALLFAGALHLDVAELVEQKWPILVLATVGVALSTAIVGTASWLLFRGLGVDAPLSYCLLFGALVSPTDPVAVGAMLKRAGVPKDLEVQIAGESLFNDGFGVVLFVVIAGVAIGGEAPSVEGVVRLFAEEVLGGLAYGAILGWIVYRMLKSVDNYQVEILLTLALVTGGYALANRLHVSGALAMVVAGLFIGNHGRAFAMSERTRVRLDSFWELIDDFLNAVLFVLIGAEVIVLEFDVAFLAAGIFMIPIAIAARFLSVGAPIVLLRRALALPRHAVKVLVGTGLRGGISVALALSLPAGAERDLLVTVTYVVVAFSIIVQGLAVEPFLRRLDLGSS